MKFIISIDAVSQNQFVMILITFCLVSGELTHITIFKETVFVVGRIRSASDMGIGCINVIHQVFENRLTGGVGNDTVVETGVHTCVTGCGNRVVVSIKQRIGCTPGFSLVILVGTAEGQFHVMALAHDEVKLQLTKIVPITGIFSDTFFMEGLAGEIATFLIIDTVLGGTIAKRFGNEGIQRLIVGHPCTTTCGGSVMGV